MLLCFIHLHASGQTQFSARHYGVEDGLSQSSVWCILQDSQGFMWFGTADGLNRFDGYNFKVFRHNAADPHSLQSNTVWSLLEDRDGMLWVGTVNGLHRYDRRTGRFTFLPGDSSYRSTQIGMHINSLVEDHDGNIWVGSAAGICVVNRQTGATREYDMADFGWQHDGRVGRVHFVDDAGDVWVSLPRHLMRFDRASRQFKEISLPTGISNQWLHLFRDRKGTIWMANAGTGDGLFAYNAQTSTWRQWAHDPNNPQSISSNLVRTAHDDDEGRLWVGTISAGLNILNADGKTFDRFVPALSNSRDDFYDKVSSICRDRSGILWIGYDGAGIIKINPHRTKFQHILLPPSDKGASGDNFFKALMVDGTSRIWLGMYNQGVAIYERGTGTVHRMMHDPEDPGSLVANAVFALQEDHRGTVWIGTVAGLDAYDPRSRSIRHNVLPGIQSGRSNIITALHEDSSGVLWIGTGERLLKYNRPRNEIEIVLDVNDIDPLYPYASVLCVSSDRSGLWCGTAGAGLLRLTTGGTLAKRHMPQSPERNSISHNVVKTICTDPDGILWIGTEDGLNRFDPEKEVWQVFRTVDGLPNDFIYGLLMDRQRNLWISTNRGISRMNTQDPDHPIFRNYTPDDGLQSYEFNTNTYFQTPQGEMLFGGVNGFNIFHPDSVHDNRSIPRIALAGFKKFDQPFDPGGDISTLKEVRLEPGETVFSFEFVALEFTNPSSNQYAYTMEGFDNEWIYCGTRREARYTNLDPGEYVFRVKGSNNDGVWNDEGTSIRVVVIPPFWKTGWFILCAAVSGVVAFGAGIRYFSTRKLRRTIEQLEREKAIHEERQRTRERIARDLHDDLASTVGSAGLFIESVKHQLPDAPTEAKEFLDRTSSLLTEAEQAMSDIVWSVSPQHDTLESLLLRIRLLTADVCKAAGMKYEVDVDVTTNELRLAEDTRRSIFLVFKEAISNAARHSGATLVHVKIKVAGNVCELTISDNGKGLPAKQDGPTQRGHGLRNMENRAKEIGAEYSFVTIEGKGTTICLTVRIT